MNYKIKRFFQVNILFPFKKWLNKPERTFVSPYEKKIFSQFIHFVHLINSKCYVDLELNKRYIENRNLHILYIISDKNVIIINEKERNYELICYNTYVKMCKVFDYKLSLERKEMEKEYLEDTASFLDKLDSKLKS